MGFPNLMQMVSHRIRMRLAQSMDWWRRRRAFEDEDDYEEKDWVSKGFLKVLKGSKGKISNLFFVF